MSTISTNPLLAQLRSMAAAAQAGAATTAPDNTEDTAFSSVLANAIGDVNHDMQVASEFKKAFVSGDRKVDLSEVMVASQKAKVEFELVLQVRNKLLSAYHDVMNMQI